MIESSVKGLKIPKFEYYTLFSLFESSEEIKRSNKNASGKKKRDQEFGWRKTIFFVIIYWKQGYGGNDGRELSSQNSSPESLQAHSEKE